MNPAGFLARSGQAEMNLCPDALPGGDGLQGLVIEEFQGHRLRPAVRVRERFPTGTFAQDDPQWRRIAGSNFSCLDGY
ncbi:MAG TPA: hypothetical protein VN693_04615 [Rhodanobacteraceae bacterium]|nr:hypothetical protein [Rhodanobacteraceae bacterium]